MLDSPNPVKLSPYSMSSVLRSISYLQDYLIEIVYSDPSSSSNIGKSIYHMNYNYISFYKIIDTDLLRDVSHWYQ